MERNTLILSFPGTNTAIKAETVLLAAGISAAVMPLPPGIRAGCGIALRVTVNEIDRAREVLGDIPHTVHEWKEITNEA